MPTALVMVPVLSVPVMGFGVIASFDHGMGWDIIAGILAPVGAVGPATLIVAVAAAGRCARSPLPLL